MNYKYTNHLKIFFLNFVFYLTVQTAWNTNSWFLSSLKKFLTKIDQTGTVEH